MTFSYIAIFNSLALSENAIPLYKSARIKTLATFLYTLQILLKKHNHKLKNKYRKYLKPKKKNASKCNEVMLMKNEMA